MYFMLIIPTINKYEYNTHPLQPLKRSHTPSPQHRQFFCSILVREQFQKRIFTPLHDKTIVGESFSLHNTRHTVPRVREFTWNRHHNSSSLHMI